LAPTKKGTTTTKTNLNSDHFSTLAATKKGTTFTKTVNSDLL